MNRLIRKHGFAEMIFDHESACQLQSILDEGILSLEQNPCKALVVGCLKQDNVHSSIAPGIYAARIKSIIGSDVTYLIPEVQMWTTEELEENIQAFLQNFAV